MGLNNEKDNLNIVQCKEFLINNSSENGSSKLFSIAEIEPSLFLCGASMVTDGALTKLGITCVISVCPELPPVPLPDCVTRHYLVDIRDTLDSQISVHFDEVSNIINRVQEKGGKTLIHCVAGVSRSATLCIAYLMKCRKKSLSEAFWHVYMKRQCIRPNNSFFEQLISFEEKLTGTSTVKMSYNKGAKGVIPDIYEAAYRNTTNYIERFIGTK